MSKRIVLILMIVFHANVIADNKQFDPVKMMQFMSEMYQLWSAWNKQQQASDMVSDYLPSYQNYQNWYPTANSMSNPMGVFANSASLDGVWRAAGGDLLIIEGNRFKIYSGQQSSQSTFVIQNNQFIIHDPISSQARQYNFQQQGENIALQDEQGQILYFQRIYAKNRINIPQYQSYQPQPYQNTIPNQMTNQPYLKGDPAVTMRQIYEAMYPSQDDNYLYSPIDGYMNPYQFVPTFP